MTHRTSLPVDEPEEFRTPTAVPTRRERRRIEQTHDELALARCPLCHAPLIARQRGRRPAFVCACV